MGAGLPSEIVGTAGLWLALAAAIGIALAMRGKALDARRVRLAGAATLALQLAHCTEEYLTGFHRHFPAALGLAPWSDRFFLLFNGSWLTVWALALVALRRVGAPLPSRAALWFLALAGVANAVAHPLLAWRAGGYFPGLASAVPLGIAAALLAGRLSGR